MSLMRHSDRRLTDKIYTDENLLGTWGAIELLPSYLAETSQPASQGLVANGQVVSLPDTTSDVSKGVQTIDNKGESHDLAEGVTDCHKMKLAGVTGLEPATSAVTGQRSEPVELHPRPSWLASRGLEAPRTEQARPPSPKL
jgi:hypothetical protein